MALSTTLWTSNSADVPQPGSLALATRDIDHARQHLSRIFAAHRLVPAGRARSLDFRHYCAPLNALSLHGVQYGESVTVEAPALADFYLLQFTVHGTCEIACGPQTTVLKPGSILVANPTRPYRKHWGPDCRQLIVRIETGLLRRVLDDLLGRVPDRALEFDLVPKCADEGGATLARFAEFICRDFDGPAILSQPWIRRSMADTLSRLLLATMPHSYSEVLDRPAELPAPRFIRRAEDFIRAHIGSDITIAEVSSAAGISTRTLHRGFRSFRDTTPLGFIKAVRLSAARRALLAGEQPSVTEIAASCGLAHLGNFARDYRRQFGELPSETLRRGSKR